MAVHKVPCEALASLVPDSRAAPAVPPTQMCQAAHKPLVVSRGKLFNVGSITGLQPVPLRGIYR